MADTEVAVADATATDAVTASVRAPLSAFADARAREDSVAVVLGDEGIAASAVSALEPVESAVGASTVLATALGALPREFCFPVTVRVALRADRACVGP
ncbi:hypothetical protein ACXDF8_06520 [Mycolicibacterium sp. CBM1]